MKTILKIFLVLTLLHISSQSLMTSTNEWAGVSDKTIKKVHVLASNYKNRGHEIKERKRVQKNTTIKLIGSVILNIIFLGILIF